MSRRKPARPSLAKKILIPLCILVALALVVAGIFLIRHLTTRVEVQPVNMLIVPWAENVESTYGFVSSDTTQTVLHSPTKIVEEILVSPGEKVKKGQVLLKYDNTTKLLDVQLLQLAVLTTERELEDLEKELKEVKRTPVYRASFAAAPDEEAAALPAALGTENVCLLLKGEGTADSPYVYLCPQAEEIPYAFFEERSEAAAALGQDLYVQVQTRAQDDPAGQVTGSMTLVFSKEGGFTLLLEQAPLPQGPQPTQAPQPSAGPAPTPTPTPTSKPTPAPTATAAPSEPAEPEESYAPMEPEVVPGMTPAEKNEAIRALNQQISQKSMELRKAQLEYEQAKLLQESGQLTATTDGVVEKVGDPATAKEGEVLVRVVSQGGCTVLCTVSELRIQDLSVGDPVTGINYETGLEFTGTIEKLGDYPQTGMYFGGNANASFYPAYVRVQEDVVLEPGQYVEIRLQPTGQSNGFFIESAYVREENGSYYVMADEGGLLERRPVRIGRILYNYTEVLAGLSPEDSIAFPYEKNAREGARTQSGLEGEMYTEDLNYGIAF